ncbi:MAG: hypothetical protein FJY65_12590 [Calditrichaeota bacterium]|nr:hypothetical protein [Calditrichota bacterium]
MITQYDKNFLLLENALIKKPQDYGNEETFDGGCGCGCLAFIRLKGRLGDDWGVCVNPNSHRCGLLTFEHQGCEQAVYDKLELDMILSQAVTG